MAKGNFIMSDENDKTPQTVTIEEFNALKATNERILSEHKSDKMRWNKKQTDAEMAEAERLRKTNNHEALFNQSQVKVGELEKELMSTRYDSFEKNLTLEVGKLAKDAHSPNQIMRALSINEANTDLKEGTLIDLSAQIDGLRKSEPNLFKVEQTTQTTTVPRYMTNNGNGKEKTVGEMSVSELEQQVKQRAAARS